MAKVLNAGPILVSRLWDSEIHRDYDILRSCLTFLVTSCECDLPLLRFGSMVEKLIDFNESSSVIVSVYWTLYNIDIVNDLKGGDRGGWLGGL